MNNQFYRYLFGPTVDKKKLERNLTQKRYILLDNSEEIRYK